MIHKKLLSLLVLLMTAASGAWATVYNSGEVNSAVLKVGDIIYDAQIGNIFKLAANRYKYQDAVQNVNSAPFTNVDVGKTGTIMTNYKPVTADGQDGNAWVVVEKMSVSPNSGEVQVLLGGIIYDPNSVYPATDAQKEGDPFTEATFTMPAFDATVSYELVRDMEVDVKAVVASRIRIQNVSGSYAAVTPTQLNPVVTDDLDSENPVTLNVVSDESGDYTLQLQKKGENDTWTDATDLSEGVFRYKVTGANLYDGETTTNEFTLFEGYALEVPAGKYATFYATEAVKVDESTADGQLYTISNVSGDKAVLSSQITTAPAETPLLVYNSSTDEAQKNIILIPTEDTADNVTAATAFKGTSEAKATTDDGYGPWNMAEGTKYYGFNGTDFMWIKYAGDVAAHRCWLELGTGNNARMVTLASPGATGVGDVHDNDSVNDNGVWHDLSGRKLNGKPTRKGVYIVGGQKRAVK